MSHSINKEEFLKQQIQETVDQSMANVPVRLAIITCPCGWKRSIVFMYKCLYCNLWFCVNCAEEHFGKTIKQYQSENFKQL